ncbi:bifunctional nicotinamidase/pyrazinamidase [Vibrio gangliei]|uniref:bifunctional nicotinamidase/pyrazinamidase n=1 Tax=Vibrio gangliei TaxID=2077090 RepID=UPI0013001CE9|nr:bifunctional nicotinamidase/pyrazinamidase [Vibrio gangliei]
MQSINKSALIIVDMQNSFVEGDDLTVHSLAVQGGRELVEGINQFQQKFDLVIATKDWHPADHGSFASQYPEKNVFDMTTLNGVEQILWPDHCVQHSIGAEFVDGLDIDNIAHITYKGTDPKVDSYSGFKDNNNQAKTDLDDVLKSHAVTDIYVVGLAADFCVKATAIDGAMLGYKTFFIKDLTAAVIPTQDNLNTLYQELEDAGVQVIEASQV